MTDSICLFMSPSESSLSYPDKVNRLQLSLGLGVISGYLQDRGVSVGMSDLNVNLSEVFAGSDRSRLECIYSQSRFEHYLQFGMDREIEEVILDLISGQHLDQYRFFGVSIGADFSFLQIQFGFLLAKYLKKTYKRPVFIGGNNISFMYIFRDVFEKLWLTVLSEFDYVIKGAGEETIYQVIRQWNEGAELEEIRKTPGLMSLQDGAIAANPEYKPQVVKPDWTGLTMRHYERYMKKDQTDENLIYFYKWPDTYEGSPGQMINQYNRERGSEVEPKLILPYIFNYNCPFSCAFCTQSDYDRGSVIGGDPDRVIQDICELKEKYHTEYFYFLNNAFNFSAKFVDEFCRKIIKNNIRIHWSDCARFNHLTYERLALMKEAGCVKLTFGFESGSDKIIRLINKRIDLDHARRVLKWCHEIGIWADIEVIVGLPHEYDEDFAETCRFIVENKAYINYFWINEFFVVPNSLIGRHPEKYRIELLKKRTTYEQLLEQNLKYFKNSASNIMTSNSRLYGFNELDGRTFEDILKSDRKKLDTLNRLQNKEFAQAAQFYTALLAR